MRWEADRWTDLADTSYETDGKGDGSKEHPYIIDSEEKLAGLAYECTLGKDYAGKYFKQTANLNLGDFDWYGIGTSANAFSGTYDGGSKNISGLRVAVDLTSEGAAMSYLGLFLNVKNATIKNINIVDGYMFTQSGNSSMLFGGMVVCSITESNIENCHVQANILGNGCLGNGCYGMLGGLIGKASGNCKISDCTFAGSLTSSGLVAVGGIVGSLGFAPESTGEVTNCINYGSLTGSPSSIGMGIGGIVGICSSKSIIKNCINEGNLTGRDLVISTPITNRVSTTVGGIAGGSGRLIENCISRGVLTADTVCGGIAASIGNGTIKNCMASGQIYITEKTATSVGAILGTGGTGEAIIENCSFNGASNMDIAMFYGGSNAVTVNNSFSRVNSRKEFVGADFSAFGLVDGMNDNLPMLRSLFFLAEASSATSDEIIARLTERGFKN